MLNLFYHRYKSSASTQTKELRTTRLYIVLFSCIFLALVLYNILNYEGVTVTVEQPTQAAYEQLVLSFGSTLQCSCSQISISYGLFLKIEVRLHQVCSSPFVESQWIRSIFDDGNWSNLTINEFRSRGVAYFFVLRTLCSMAQESANKVVSGTLTGDLYSQQCIPEQQLAKQVASQISTFRASSTFSIVSILQYARDSAHDNQLLSVYASNWMLFPRNGAYTPYSTIPARPISFGSNCSCATSSACTQPVYIHGQMVPGFVLGCIPLESLLRSNLVCLFNQTCLDLINIGNLSTIQPLNLSLPSQYVPNTTVDDLLQNVLMEEWSYTLNYSQFFDQCQPSSCAYVVSRPKTALQTITILLSLYGGLTAILHFIVPHLIGISGCVIHAFRKRNSRKSTAVTND